MQCPCSAGGVGQKSLRLICLIATILAVTTRLGQPLAGSDDFVLSPSEKAQLIGSVRVCVCGCVSKIEPQTLICVWWNRSNCSLMLVPTFPWQSVRVCVLNMSLCEDYLFVCACVHDMASWFLGQTASFCACHILLSVADTASLIPCIHLSPPTSIQTLINGISENGIWFITPDYTHTRKGGYNQRYPHTQTQLFLV